MTFLSLDSFIFTITEASAFPSSTITTITTTTKVDEDHENQNQLPLSDPAQQYVDGNNSSSPLFKTSSSIINPMINNYPSSSSIIHSSSSINYSSSTIHSSSSINYLSSIIHSSIIFHSTIINILDLYYSSIHLSKDHPAHLCGGKGGDSSYVCNRLVGIFLTLFILIGAYIIITNALSTYIYVYIYINFYLYYPFLSNYISTHT